MTEGLRHCVNCGHIDPPGKTTVQTPEHDECRRCGGRTFAPVVVEPADFDADSRDEWEYLSGV